MNLKNLVNMNKIVKYLMRQSFQPDMLSMFINPFYFLRRSLFFCIKAKSHYLYGDMLDFGCGRKPYKNLFKVGKYVGVDIEVSGHSHKNSEVDIFYDGSTIPFPNETFNSFLCSEVFEHLFNIDVILKELRRVLKVGGKGLITVPFCWPEHEIPYDNARYTSYGIKNLLEKNGFKIISLEKSGHFVECIFQLSALYIYTLYNSKYRVLNLICTFLFISPINLVGIIVKTILPKNRDLFHNLVIIVEKNDANIVGSQ